MHRRSQIERKTNICSKLICSKIKVHMTEVGLLNFICLKKSNIMVEHSDYIELNFLTTHIVFLTIKCSYPIFGQLKEEQLKVNVLCLDRITQLRNNI
jgi:hypothetical protein